MRRRRLASRFATKRLPSQRCASAVQIVRRCPARLNIGQYLRHGIFAISSHDASRAPVYRTRIMNVITVKRPLRKGTRDTMVNMTGRRQYRRSLVLRSFRQISRSYFASEKSWEFVIEALLFAIIVAISAWPVFAAANALNQFLQRTAS